MALKTSTRQCVGHILAYLQIEIHDQRLLTFYCQGTSYIDRNKGLPDAAFITKNCNDFTGHSLSFYHNYYFCRGEIFFWGLIGRETGRDKLGPYINKRQ